MPIADGVGCLASARTAGDLQVSGVYVDYPIFDGKDGTSQTSDFLLVGARGATSH